MLNAILNGAFMPRFESPLNNIKIASPCKADWDGMFGNDRKRFCGECSLNVYNLSGMTQEEARHLLENSEGRLCVRFYRRADGSVLTQNCPVGWAKVKQRARVFATAAFSLIMSLLGGLMVVSFFSRQKVVEMGDIAYPFATPTPKQIPLMGAVAIQSPTPKAKPTPQATPKKEDEMVMGKVAGRN
jgi:hypothetical protein